VIELFSITVEELLPPVSQMPAVLSVRVQSEIVGLAEAISMARVALIMVQSLIDPVEPVGNFTPLLDAGETNSKVPPDTVPSTIISALSSNVMVTPESKFQVSPEGMCRFWVK